MADKKQVRNRIIKIVKKANNPKSNFHKNIIAQIDMAIEDELLKQWDSYQQKKCSHIPNDKEYLECLDSVDQEFKKYTVKTEKAPKIGFKKKPNVR
jgi:hypothetical protein